MAVSTGWAISLGPGGGAVGLIALFVSLLSLALSIASLVRGRKSGRTDEPPGRTGETDQRSPADLFAIRFAVFLALLVTFVVTQPLVWRAAFGENPPGPTADLATIVSVVLTIASLAAGVLGTFLYKTIESRMSQIALDANEKVDRRMTKLDGAQSVNLGYLSWMNYEQIWREDHYSPQTQDRPAFRAYLDMAIAMSDAGLRKFGSPPQDERDRARDSARLNLAFHLATRGRPEDAGRALDLLPPFESLDGPTVDFIETYSWVYHRLTSDERKQAEFLEKLRAALEGDVAEDERAAIKERYKGVLGKEL
jgi:hypothetical protein